MKKNNIIDFQNYKQHKIEQEDDQNEQWLVQELICVKCYHRWFTMLPTDILLGEIKCPKCKTTGTIVNTGQIIPERDMLLAAIEHLEDEFGVMQDKD